MMRLFLLGAVLLVMSAASFAETAPSGNTNSCRKAALGTCNGCSISCPEEKTAVCSEALYNWNSNNCVRDATCVCKAKKGKGTPNRNLSPSG
jgi:hypothetical protein